MKAGKNIHTHFIRKPKLGVLVKVYMDTIGTVVKYGLVAGFYKNKILYKEYKLATGEMHGSYTHFTDCLFLKEYKKPFNFADISYFLPIVRVSFSNNLNPKI
jgi:hypothetical protein